MVTERALVFEKIRLRFCRNLVFYSIPESPDIIETAEDFMQVKQWDKVLEHRLRLIKQQAQSKKNTESQEELVQQCKAVVKEGQIQNKQMSIVGLFSQFDRL